VSLPFYSGVYGVSGGSHTWTLPGSQQDGDLLFIVFNGSINNTPVTKAGWTTLTLDEFTGISQSALWRPWHTGDPTAYTFTTPSGYFHRFSWIARGADLTTPVAGHTSQGATNWATPTGPSINIGRADSALLWYAIEGNTGTITFPAGMTNGDHGGGGPSTWICRQTGIGVGASGDKVGSRTATSGCLVSMIAIQPPAQGTGNYYQWTEADELLRAWGYRLDPPNPNSTYRFGGNLPGYVVEVRFPISQGGSESGSDYSVTIKQGDGTPSDYHKWQPGAMPTVIVYPCNYTEPPIPYPDPGDLIPPGECQVTDTLASIAAILCRFDYRIGTMQAYLHDIMLLVGNMYGPWAGNYGQMGEPVAGGLGQFLHDALLAMSNYDLTGGTTVLVEGGISGDWTVGDAGNNFKIEIETFPAQAGHRVSTPALFEVTRRAEQLGWCAYELEGAMFPYQPLHWGTNYIRFPGGICTGFHVHLMIGGTADVYRVVETRTPKLT
jgi:hypothetical protein